MTPSAPELARRIADAFEAAGVPYAVGGALALAVWGFPRATNDVDLDVFVPPDDLPQVIAALRAVGCDVDDAAALASARDRGDFCAAFAGVRIDLFVPSIPLYADAQVRIRSAPLEGRPAWFLSPEDLTVFKMLFFRTKDLLDVERLVAFTGADFDRAYVRRWLVELMGEDDERVARWDRLLLDVDRATGIAP